MLHHRGKMKFKVSAAEVEHSCNSSSWTLFYEENLGEGDKELAMLAVLSDDDGLIRIVAGESEVFAGKIADLYNIFYKQDPGTSMYIYVDKVSNDYFVKFSLEGHITSSVKIYRKRESGTGDLTLKGYLLVYAEGA